MEDQLSPESTSEMAQYYKEVTIGDKKSYICQVDDCSKEFRFKSEMNRHLAVHSKQRPHVCSFPGCGKTFKRGDALSNHVRMHTSNLSFICPIQGCQNQFATKSALKYHILKHNGEKRYTCSIPGCNRAFITLAQLKQHEKASFYHQKVNHTTTDDQANKSNSQAVQSSPVKEKPSVKVESPVPESLETSSKSEPVYAELQKKLKTENNSAQIQNVLTIVNTLNQLNAKPAAAPLTVPYNPVENFGSMGIDPKLSTMLHSIMEENRLLKDRLNDITKVPLYDMYANLQSKLPLMSLYGLQQNEINRQRLAALQFNFSG